MTRHGLTLALTLLLAGCTGAPNPAALDATAAPGQAGASASPAAAPAITIPTDLSSPGSLSSADYISDARLDQVLDCVRSNPKYADSSMPGSIEVWKRGYTEAQRVGAVKESMEYLIKSIGCQ